MYIITFILLIPVYGFFLWSYFCPEESILFGRRWLYKEEPEISNEAIRFMKFASMVSMIWIPVILIGELLNLFIVRYSLVVVPVVFFIGWIRIFSRS